ncbi:MAG TPA: hypothetical protein DHV62_06070 [Elusimicrobia bacterium]|jgi:hypothetical protein|nr:hypothetical protein [Elusimicrobiota bacterium]
MTKLTEEEKNELKKIVKSSKLRDDLRKIAKNRYNPFIINRKMDLDRLLTFLTEYNHFINHVPKPFHKIVDKNNKF